MKPKELRDNTYFISGRNIELSYKNGALVATVKTPTQVWSLSYPGIKPNEYYVVDLTWYRGEGLHLMVNCAKGGHQSLPTTRTDRDRPYTRFYLGRANTDMARERYANADIESIKFWEARRDYLEAYRLIDNGICDELRTTTPMPTTRPTGPTKPGPGPDGGDTSKKTTPSTPSGPAKYIYCPGNTWVKFDDSHFSREKNSFEDLKIVFKSMRRDGLLWFTENTNGKLYLSLRGGYLWLDLEIKTGEYRQRVRAQPAGIRMDDGEWHSIQLVKQQRNVCISDYIFPLLC
jgi:hypothetical protein